jgi:inorganic triphosphatase YgiF
VALAKIEFELKLAGAPADIAAAPTLALFEEGSVGPGVWERLISTYFDSDDLDLHDKGVSLRIREEAGARILAAKLVPPGGGPISRLEAERKLAPDETGFATGVADFDALIAGCADKIRPIARTRSERWSRIVLQGGALIEIAAESGVAERLLDGHASPSPFAEIEFELLKGDAAPLFDLAGRALAATGGRLRLCALSKLDRALMGCARPAAPDLRRLRIDETTSAGDLFGAALRRVAVDTAHAAELVTDHRDSDGARRLRVALRRLRSIERVFRRAHGSDGLQALSDEAREFQRLAGAARDLDVFLAESLPIAEAAGGGAGALRAAAEAAAAKATNDLVRILTSASFGRFSLALFRMAFCEPYRDQPSKLLNQLAKDYANEALDRRWRDLADVSARVDFSDPPSLHALRIALKKFRYAAQAFRDLYPGERRKPAFAAMSALQAGFGRINDAVVAIGLAEDLLAKAGKDAARAAGFVSGVRGAEAAAASLALADSWRAFTLLTPFWRDDPTLSES